MKEMPENIRLTRQEQEDLRKKAVEINKQLVAKGKQPVKDSELAHRILEQAIKRTRLTASGEIIVDDAG